ncbi:hypothetical protein HHK36_006657 [Tetracentron sinense]|uniref:Ion transport domain-containing protein n=1 Tax=Tetracentron sinense TaxID=13715 RepID=A0A835DKJ5_TETSI|nr:hypothetical protein HHK36_006657 [Tetracentron sinense]
MASGEKDEVPMLYDTHEPMDAQLALYEYKCIVLNLTVTTTIVVFRSMTDFIYFLHMLLQFRLAYVAPESRVVGAGELVDHPKKIAVRYLSGYFLLDLFLLLPLPQIIILLAIPKFLGLSGENNANNLLRASVLVQYIVKLFRFLPLLGNKLAKGFIFESAWKNFAITFLTFMLSGHIVGSCWYILGLQAAAPSVIIPPSFSSKQPTSYKGELAVFFYLKESNALAAPFTVSLPNSLMVGQVSM